MIEVKKITFEYNNFDEDKEREIGLRVLNDISLSIKKGDFVAILGHNGSGKSTLARHINALLLPTKGDLYVNGMNTKDEKLLWEIRKTAGMVFQNPDNQIIGSVVEEDTAFGPENIGIPSEKISPIVDQALTLVGMQKYRRHSPHKLSGGQKQRIAIAGVLAMKPSCIVFDESTAMLDPRGRKEVLKTILKLNREDNITVILITHNMTEAILADRVIVLNQGKIAMDGSPRQVFSQGERLRELSLTVPQSTELFEKIIKATDYKGDIPIEVDEAVNKLVGIRKHLCKKTSMNFKTETSPIKSEQEGQDEIKREKGELILRVKNLSYIYAKDSPYEKQALKDISFDIRRGEMIGLIGHTGSGKTTLIQHLNGLIKPSSGEIIAFGQTINQKKYDLRELRQKIGLVFQYSENQLFELTVYDDIAFGLKQFKMTKEEIRKAVEDVCVLLKIDESLLNMSPFELSGGQKRRVAIAGVLVMKPEILILDEPTAGLDPMTSAHILKEIRRLNRQTRTTIILVSHDMEDIATSVDRVLVMEKGRLVIDNEVRQVFKNPDKLKDLSLDIPEITDLSLRLEKKGFVFEERPITVEEAYESIINQI